MPFVAGPFRLGGDGRGASGPCGALCFAQPGPRRAGKSAKRLAVVERARHLSGTDDELATVKPVLERYGGFAVCLDHKTDDGAVMRLRRSETTGRPVGGKAWIETLENQTDRRLKPQKRGPKGGRRRKI